ncbi:hypothetical protein EGC79_20475 [Shewanella vesiculosa]|nr:hypothetical protein EGC79_20475 [Shewanella vesiculosa]
MWSSSWSLVMSVASDLRRLDAPRKVLEAGEEIDKQVEANVPVSMSLSRYVRDWVTRNQGNNRYGK